MRILHVTPSCPLPGGGGASTRQFYLLRRLVERGHEVTVVAPVAVSQRDQAAALEAAGIDSLNHLRPASRVRETLWALARRPGLAVEAVVQPVLAWQAEVFWTTLRSNARRTVQQRRPDVISVETDNAASWAGDLDPTIPAVLTLDEVAWNYYASRARSVPGGVPARALALEAARFKRHDLHHFSRYRTLITISESDMEVVRSVSAAPVEVVPNGFDVHAVTDLPDEGSEPCVLFTGTMSHPPNIEGIGWFVDEVWPKVTAAQPQARLLIVGRDPPRSVQRMANDRIEVTGTVPSTLPYFARAKVAIAPLHSGGTARVKVFEALGAGRALVTTTVGAHGVAITDGQDALIADDPDSFAAAVLRILNDDALRREIARAGRGLAERLYDWRVLGDRFERILSAAADR